MKDFVVGWLRSRALQSIWSRLHRLSLIAMNFWSSNLCVSGEIKTVAHVARKLEDTPNPVIFDVGANVGEFSAICLDAFSGDCIVHAFEPSPRTYALLQAHFSNRPGAAPRLHNFGFSDSVRDGKLYSSEAGSTIASVYDLENPLRPFRAEFTEIVSLSTVDRFCGEQGIDRIDFLKLDIEGHEYAVLLGASAMLEQGRIRFLQFEFGENNVASRTYLADFHRLLADRYDMYRIVPKGLVPWRYDGGASEIFATMNYFCELKG